jgi:riboflavin kinase/FMN adenylyltransferase
MEPLEQPSAVTFGTFDGVHIGHQAVIGKTVSTARDEGLISAVISFDPHPLKFIDPDKAPPLLTLSAKKLKLFKRLGVDIVVLAKLEPELAEMSASQFIERILYGKLRAKKVIVGPDCSFGKGRTGNVDLLKRKGTKLGFEVKVVFKRKINGMAVSSTRVRERISAGDLALAEEMLGRRYSIMGRVVRGDGIGRSIGYPTANLDTDDQLLPPRGVYAVWVKIEGDRFKGLLNIGRRPTLGGGDVRVEVYILDFDRDIYDRWVEIEFVRKIRGEKQFDSLKDLARQIERDESAAREILLP